jgi:hypothetical protein
MSLDQHAEEILLESNDELISEPSEETLKQITAHLVQIQKWKRHNLGTQILDKRFLFVKQYVNGRITEYWVNLLFADPVPKREFYTDWRWGIAALILLLNSAGLFVVDKVFHLSSKFSYLNSITILLATLALISLITMIYKSRNTLVFRTLNGRVPILSLTFNYPSKQEFSTYAKILRQCIERVQAHNAHRMNDLLANELAQHRHLKEHKVISAQEYETAKNRILSQH